MISLKTPVKMIETPVMWPIGIRILDFGWRSSALRDSVTITPWINWRGCRYSVAIRIWGDKHLHRGFLWMKHDWRRR